MSNCLWIKKTLTHHVILNWLVVRVSRVHLNTKHIVFTHSNLHKQQCKQYSILWHTPKCICITISTRIICYICDLSPYNLIKCVLYISWGRIYVREYCRILYIEFYVILYYIIFYATVLSQACVLRGPLCRGCGQINTTFIKLSC